MGIGNRLIYDSGYTWLGNAWIDVIFKAQKAIWGVHFAQHTRQISDETYLMEEWRLMGGHGSMHF